MTYWCCPCYYCCCCWVWRCDSHIHEKHVLLYKYTHVSTCATHTYTRTNTVNWEPSLWSESCSIYWSFNRFAPERGRAKERDRQACSGHGFAPPPLSTYRRRLTSTAAVVAAAVTLRSLLSVAIWASVLSVGCVWISTGREDDLICKPQLGARRRSGRDRTGEGRQSRRSEEPHTGTEPREAPQIGRWHIPDREWTR